MATITDYVVITDEAFEVDGFFGNVDGNKVFKFELPNDFVPGTNRARPVLSYVVSYLSDTGSFAIRLNPSTDFASDGIVQVLRWDNPPVNFEHGNSEIIHGEDLKVGSNTLVFSARLEDNILETKIKFRDVVLWFQREI